VPFDDNPQDSNVSMLKWMKVVRSRSSGTANSRQSFGTSGWNKSSSEDETETARGQKATAKAEEGARIATEKAAAEAKAEEDARIAAEKSAAKAKAEEEACIAAEKAVAEAKAEEEVRIAAEKAASKAKAEEESRIAGEKAAAEAKAEEETRIAAEKAAVEAKVETVDVDAGSIDETVTATKSETKAVVESGVPNSLLSLSRKELTALTVVVLKEKLREAGKPVSGKKSVLIDRLLS